MHQAAWISSVDILLMIVRTLAIRLMILALTLASGPAPNAGSYEAGERLTAKNVSDKTCADIFVLEMGVNSYCARGNDLRKGQRWR